MKWHLIKSRISVALTYLNISLSDINVKYFSWTFFRQMVESTVVATTAALKFGQIMLDVCSSFALEVDMSFNSSKSVVMHVGTRFKLPCAPVMLRSSMMAQMVIRLSSRWCKEAYFTRCHQSSRLSTSAWRPALSLASSISSQPTHAGGCFWHQLKWGFQQQQTAWAPVICWQVGPRCRQHDVVTFRWKGILNWFTGQLKQCSVIIKCNVISVLHL